MRWIFLIAVVVLGVGSFIYINSNSVESSSDQDSPANVVTGAGDGPSRGPLAPRDTAPQLAADGAAAAPIVDSDTSDPELEEMADLAGLMLDSSATGAFPGLELSPDEVDQLAAATVQLRQAETQLEEVGNAPEDDALRQALSDEIDAATQVIGDVMETSLLRLSVDDAVDDPRDGDTDQLELDLPRH